MLGVWLGGMRAKRTCRRNGPTRTAPTSTRYANYIPCSTGSRYREPSDITDSEYKMMVLCDKYRRGKNHRIHLLPFPIWIMKRNQRPDFVFVPDEINPKGPQMKQTSRAATGTWVRRSVVSSLSSSR